MITRRGRSFSVGDALILIAATAVGFAGNRLMHWGIPVGLPVSLRGHYYSTWIERTQLASLPCLLTWTLGAVAIGLRGTGPALRRRPLGPGIIVCIAATIAIVADALWILVLSLAFPATFATMVGDREMIVHAERVGFAVLGSWLTLALTGRPRPLSGWADRLGRILGALWLLMGAATLLRLLVFALL